jgi:hypothetical protein
MGVSAESDAATNSFWTTPLLLSPAAQAGLFLWNAILALPSGPDANRSRFTAFPMSEKPILVAPRMEPIRMKPYQLQNTHPKWHERASRFEINEIADSTG